MNNYGWITTHINHKIKIRTKRKIPISRAVDMLLKLLIYLEGNWKNMCKTRANIALRTQVFLIKMKNTVNFLNMNLLINRCFQTTPRRAH